jgi:diguanylate cyclase (GGDEF)-like protein
LAALARALEEEQPLELSLQRVVECAAGTMETERVSVRLLDATRTRLIAACRAGTPLHVNAGAEFRLGEGLIGWIAERQLPLRTGDAESDPRFVHRPDMVSWMGSFVGVPMLAHGTSIGVLAAVNPKTNYFTTEHEELLTLLSALCVPRIELGRLRRLGQLDALTGVLNAEGVELALQRTVVDAARGAVAGDGADPLSIALADLDALDTINDEHGRQIGDEVLRRVADILASVLRESDSIVRLSGDEFLLVLPSLDLQTASRVADRARITIGQQQIAARAIPVRVTLSLGVAQRRRGEDRDALIARANQALQRAKTDGRDRVCRAED